MKTMILFKVKLMCFSKPFGITLTLQLNLPKSLKINDRHILLNYEISQVPFQKSLNLHYKTNVLVLYNYYYFLYDHDL